MTTRPPELYSVAIVLYHDFPILGILFHRLKAPPVRHRQFVMGCSLATAARQRTGGRMDKLTRYRTLIKQAMVERAQLMRSQPLPGEEVVCILDETTDNYLLVRLGWVRAKRLYSVTLHLRLV